jgi:glycosyltransferase 2 family protein
VFAVYPKRTSLACVKAMKPLKILYLLIGVGLLAFVLNHTDLPSLWLQLGNISWGILVVLVVYKTAFIVDTFAWQFTLPSTQFTKRWLYNLWKVRMVGAAFAKILPFSAWGGAPIKGFVLKHHYGIDYREGTASLILAESTHMISMVLFMTTGVCFILFDSKFPESFHFFAVIGLSVITLGIFLFYLVQRYKITSLTGSWLSQRKLGQRLEKFIHQIQDMDERLVKFYTTDRRRFLSASFLNLVNWYLGALEIFSIFYFLGHPITIVDSIILETLIELVRASTFFIPATLGSQEAAFMMATGALAGQPALGVAAALMRRVREIIWLIWGFSIGLEYSQKPFDLAADAQKDLD